MAHVVPPLQNEVSATVRNFPDLVSKGQRLPNTAVWRSFRLFGTRFVDINMSKCGPIASLNTNNVQGLALSIILQLLRMNCESTVGSLRSLKLVILKTY